MSFIRLNGTDDLLAREGIEASTACWREITEIVDRAAADLDVCWLETQAEANSVRWTLIAGAPTATERDGERLLRVLRRIADETPVPLADRRQPRCGVRRRHGPSAAMHVHRDGRRDQPRCSPDGQGDAGQIIAGERLYNTCPRPIRAGRRSNRSWSRASVPRCQAFVVGQVSSHRSVR